MFTIRLATRQYPPDENVVMHSFATGWDQPISGLFRDGAWLFTIGEDRPVEFKFVLERDVWMEGPNLAVPGANGVVYTFDDGQVCPPSGLGLDIS